MKKNIGFRLNYGGKFAHAHRNTYTLTFFFFYHYGDEPEFFKMKRLVLEKGMAIHSSILAWKMDQGAWRAIVHGVAKRWIQLSD